MILKRKLTKAEQRELLSKLFGFYFEGDVLIDDNGEEFYRFNGNAIFQFETLDGVFAYAVHRAKMQGFRDGETHVRVHIRKALGID